MKTAIQRHPPFKAALPGPPRDSETGNPDHMEKLATVATQSIHIFHSSLIRKSFRLSENISGFLGWRVPALPARP
ncbi:hypothetical protein MPTK1_6g08940 [Marchantia polymorpha subsp. ruderalis]|uniref:Uncharacterized protein n=2 Tax=Marchantia polymorpha TaxID=3197 RepID=A0AAF6BQ27_MARPO|nr:hypothetical protein MARPO_0060s0025 [Marchantia polymorpha]BBN14111.1 hypothetical protein Mp_6g08940 [Marchantia polymorpha subsp. ruderalis]|eukprot:PTQ36932.1 hypothetical protein MARPO_0060s0025 [Marchantia polymorpha]